MTINLQTGVYTPPQTLPGARGADIQVAKKQGQKLDTELPALPEQSKNPATASSAEEQRYQKVVFAAQRVIESTYPVTDKSFTIYRDFSTGQYVTRYVSLRDGKVTYVPEAKQLESIGGRVNIDQAVISIQA